MTEMNVLTNDIETVIQKINNHQITDCNDEIKNIGSRTNTCYEKHIKIEDMRDSLREREDEIIKDPKKVLSIIDWTDRNKMIEEWKAFRDEFDTKWNIYKDKAKTFKSKIKTFPCIRRYQDEVDKITEDRKILVPDIEKWITEEKDLIKDVDKVILKIDNHQITELNDEIKNIASRLYGNLVKGSEIENKINELKEMGNKIRERDPLLNRSNICRIEAGSLEKIDEDPLVDLIDWHEYNKSLNALRIFHHTFDFDNNTKELKSLNDTFIDKLHVFKSKIKNFPAVRKLQNEVANMTSGMASWKTLLSDNKKLLSEMDLLIKDIDRVIGKIDRREITNYNNEIKDVNNRISSINDKSDDINHRVDELNDELKGRKDKIFESEYLSILVDWTDSNKTLEEWEALMDEEGNPKCDIYNKKLYDLISKVKNFTAVRKLQDEVADITDGWKILLSDKKNLLSEMDPLIKDIDRAMEKIYSREIEKYNKEIKNICNRINSLNEKNDDISSRKDNLNYRGNAVHETPGIGNLVDWTDRNKAIDEWNDFVDEEDQPKWDIYNKKLDVLKSKVKNFSPVCKLQNKLKEIIKEDEILISDKKKLLSEMDLLMKDMDRVIEKINRREITNYNNEIKDIDYRINIVHNKNNDISRRNDEFNRKVNAVSKTPGVGCMVDWTDKNKVVDEWNTFRDEEDIPKWDIFNKKVETFNSITANLSNHP